MARARGISGLVFDKDGTLFDFDRTWGGWTRDFIRDLAGGNRQAEAALARAYGFDPARGAFEKDSPVIAGTVEVVVEATRRVLPGWDAAALRRHITQSAAAARQVPAADLGALFARLRGAGLSLGIATNDAEAAARAHLEREGIAGHFDLIAGYDSGYGAKPDPGMLRAFCDACGLAGADCAMIGDSTHDLQAGRAAGMTTLGVLTGRAGREDLAGLADAVLADISEIPDWLGLE